MRLLNTSTLRLEIFQGDANVPYAILSHTWGEDELLFEDLDPAKNPEIGKLATAKAGLGKVLGAINQAVRSGHAYIWIDTCCIDKSSSAELSEAINPMFAWYSKAEVCYVYLSDFSAGENMEKSRWFTRGWTLQELIAPEFVDFFDTDWVPLGTRQGLAQQLTAITGLPKKILVRERPRRIHQSHKRPPNRSLVRDILDAFSVSARMLWAANRQTTRVEDRYYSLMGLFDVNMPLLYGEGTKAFQRLQEIILAQTNDQSILAFEPPPGHLSPLAGSPEQFIPNLESPQHLLTKSMSIVSGEIEVDVLLCEVDSTRPGSWTSTRYPGAHYLAILQCNIVGHFLKRIGIMLQSIDSELHTFTRVDFTPSNAFDDDPIPVCFELDPENGLEVWALARSRLVDCLSDPENFRIPIGEFQNRRILITLPRPGYLERRVTKIPLQISLRGSHSDQFELRDTRGQLYETVEGFCRYEVFEEGDSGWDQLQPRDGEKFWPPQNSSDFEVERLWRFDVFYTRGLRVDVPDCGFRVEWGIKFPRSKETHWDLREDEMVCFVKALESLGSTRPWYEADRLPGRVSACWNKQLGLIATAEIRAETLLDRTCGFLEVTMSASEGPSAVLGKRSSW